MKVRFLQDYRGHLTEEKFYVKDSVVDLPSGSDLVEAGRAEAVVEDKPKPEPKKETSKPAAKKKRGRPKKKAK